MDHAAHHVHAAAADHAAPESLAEFLRRLFEVYVPREQCMYHQPDVIWLNVVANAMIAVAYYSIPIALYYFARRRKDLSYNWMFLLFAAFILFCGTTHLLDVIAIWRPYYRLDGIVSLLTGMISLTTAVMLWPLIPRALALPSPTQLRLTNQQLEREIAERRQVQEELRRAYDELELRVRQRTAELAESEARMRAIVETAADGILVTDAAGLIESFNPAAERIFGYRAGEGLGARMDDLVAEPHSHALGEWFGHCDNDGIEPPAEASRLAEGPGRRYHEVQGLRRDGSTVPLELACSQTSRDAHRRFIVILRDITDRKLAEEALREADRRKDEFLAMLSHELRNPLAPIRNAAHVIRLRGGDDPILHKQFEVINRQVGHVARLVDDLLDVSRITRGKITLRKERTTLQEAIHNAEEEVRALITRLGHHLHLEMPASAVWIQADPVRLQQVFSNLLSNSAKYMDAGGRIDLTVRLSGGMAAISVKDHGIGIPAEVLPHIFDLFVQADKSLDRTRGGLGIGLTLVKSLVEMHGGRVEARSAGPGAGAEFLVHLPILPPSEAA